MTIRLIFTIATTVAMIACGSSSPTAPSAPVTVTPPVSVTPTPPVVVTPPVVTPPAPPAFPPNDPRFDLTFYRQFVHNALEAPGKLEPLRRQAEAPRIYLRTIDDGGAAIDRVTLDRTAAALINTTGALTGVFGLAGLEQGTDTKQGQRGWITVRWSTVVDNACGRASVGGDLVTLYPKQPGCRCAGNPAVIDMATVKHELGHALGFWHTDNQYDLMYAGNFGECDKNPSAREIYHAALAYTRPIGSAAP